MSCLKISNKILYKKIKIFAKRILKIGLFSKKLQMFKVCKRSKMALFRTPSGDYFRQKIDLRHTTRKNSVEYDRFFCAESDSSNGFWPSHPDFTVLPNLQGCQIHAVFINMVPMDLETYFLAS